MNIKHSLVLIIIFLGISHVFIPHFNHHQDFLIFGEWNMFSSGVKEEIVDISWDKEKTFLFRDHREEAREARIDIHSLFYLLMTNQRDTARNQFKEKLEKFCQCQSVEFVNQKNRLFQHIVKKIPGETISREEL